MCSRLPPVMRRSSRLPTLSTMPTSALRLQQWIPSVELDYGCSEEAGDMIIKVVLGLVDEAILADWLREKSKA